MFRYADTTTLDQLHNNPRTKHLKYSTLEIKGKNVVHLRTSSPPLAILATAGPLAITGARSLLALAGAGPLLAIPGLGAGLATTVVTPIPTSVVAARMTNIHLGAASPGAS
jgi:hypothetical protein